MAWKILCTLSSVKLESLAKDYEKNKAGATKNYRHAWVMYSSTDFNPGADPATQTIYIADFCDQVCSSRDHVERLEALEGADGYFTGLNTVSIILDEGSEKLTKKAIATFGERFEPIARATVKKGYPTDCLGYCIGLIQEVTKRDKVAGLSVIAAG